MKSLVLKHIFLGCAILVSSIAANAQEVGNGLFKPLEFELAGGTGVALNKVGFDINKPLILAKAELRYNTPSRLWDIGVGAQLERSDRIHIGDILPASYAAAQFYAVGDYNWNINNSLSAFVGLAAGVSANIPIFPDGPSADDYQAKKLSPFVAPRFGIEAWDRLRFTVALNLMDSAHSNVGLSLGYTIGGRGERR